MAATRNGRVGVIGTEATLASGAYPRALLAERPGIEIFTQACPLFVPLAEEGWVDNEIARAVVDRYLAGLVDSGIDTLVLGCTHYPLLAPAIRACLGPDVTVVDSAAATAGALERALDEGDLRRSGLPGRASFYVSDVPDRFIRLGARFYGNSVASAQRVVLQADAGFAGTHTAG